MSITFNETKKIFTLHTAHSSYQMMVDAYGFLLHLYYGRKTDGEMDYLLTFADRGFSSNPYCAEKDRTYSLDALPQEFPFRGSGDFRSPALIIEQADGSFDCDLRFANYQIYDGKYRLDGLPAVYADSDKAQTLEIELVDAKSNLHLTLLYGVLPDCDIITRSVRVTHRGENPVTLRKILSANLDFVHGNYDLIQFYGRHAMERNLQRTPVLHGAQSIGSRRGTSSHQYSPLMILAEHSTTEQTGSCYAMSFVYSGGFQGEVEKDQFNQTRLQLGLLEECFAYPLANGQTFYAPEVMLSYSQTGLSTLSQNLHTCCRAHICRGKYQTTPRPILLNSWEASYFDFTGESILSLAKEAAELGIDLLVLDDGWFGVRNNDYAGLGDWNVNEEKLGCSLNELIQQINDLGLKFGLWFEPEMVNEDSDLYRQHPDWALRVPDKPPIRGRYQFVLDFSRKEVVDAIYAQVCAILDQGNIEYIKWDMNRSICDVYSITAKNQGTVLYNYMLGLYDFLERIVTHYPNILIEGCSGGGGRFDAGMLYYTPQIWCSDNTDALDRLRIQYGTSFGYPISMVGSHVSIVPNHQTGRSVPMNTRAITAMAGTFGYELDLKKLSSEEKEEIRTQIQAYRKYANLICHGDYYRLSNPFTDEIAAWEFVSKDKTQVLLNVVMLEVHGNMTDNYLMPQGLQTGAAYVDENGHKYSADALMEMGLPLPTKIGAYHAYQIYLSREDSR